MSKPVLALGTTGLTAADLGFRFYRNGVADTEGVAAALTLTHLGAGDYRVNGLPTAVGDGTWLTLTYEYPAGVGGHYVYPTPQDEAPPNVVVPIRTTGLVEADLELALHKDGVLQADDLTVSELVVGGGDYLVSGWPTDEPGAWLLVWRESGLSFWSAWSYDVDPDALPGIITDLLDMFGDTFQAIPGTMDYQGAFTPAGTVLTIPCYIEGSSRLVRDDTGREVVSSVQVICAGHFDLTTHLHRYTLPSRYSHKTSLRAIAVPDASDESGPHHNEVWFP